MEALQKVYSLLEDQESKDIYLDRINYTISGELKYLHHIIDEYVPDLGRAEKSLSQDIEEKYPNRDVVIWGCGHYVDTNVSCWKEIKALKCFCDKSEDKQLNGYKGYDVISPEELVEKYRDAIVIIGTSNYFSEIKQELMRKGLSEKDIVNFGNYVPMSSSRQYFEEEFLQFNADEVFVDAGAFDLFTTKKMQEMCHGKLKKSYAFEPDVNNYQNCLSIKEKENLSFVNVLQYGTWDCDTILKFSSTGTADSDINENGDCEITAKTIDEIVKDRVTYIKMDVEGAELKSLIGARDTICANKPKLAICIYHKPEDLTEIPLYIHSLVAEYKFYIRHYSNNECETVLYAVL